MEEKSVVSTRVTDKNGFVYSVRAVADSIEDCMEDIRFLNNKHELTAWQDGRNLLGAPGPTNMVDEGNNQVGKKNLGTLNLPPKTGECQVGDTYECGVSLYSHDGEYIRFYKRIKVDGNMVVTKYPVLSQKLDGKGLEDFKVVFPDFEPEIGSKLELPKPQFLFIEVGPNLNSNQNPYHNLKGTRDA